MGAAERELVIDTPPRYEPAAAVRSSAATRLLATLATVAGLWWGQRFLVPVVTGLMLVMLVTPLTKWLEHHLRSRTLATLLTLALVMGALAEGALVFGGQLVRVAERTPEMISMAAQQLADRDPAADSVITRARDALHELDRAAERVMSNKPLRPARRAAVAAAPAASSPASTITAGATVVLRETAVTGSSALLALAGQLSIIFLVAFFVLMGGKPLTERFLGLWEQRADVHARAQTALLECARQVRIYAGVLLVANTLIGLSVWVVFSLTGLPDAAGWGVTAAVLHVIPYLGMAVLTGLGAAETFLAHGTMGAALGMALFVVTLSTLIGTVVTAWLQGRAAKMSSAAVFIGLVFWGALWGLWGLFLGPALVVVMKVVLEHTPSGARLARLMQG
ncbi:MAG TPA: AI-2E family transporter [Rhizobacter sp.]|nr:AI-2E family transporter [Rhizobacter sp.]